MDFVFIFNTGDGSQGLRLAQHSTFYQWATSLALYSSHFCICLKQVPHYSLNRTGIYSAFWKAEQFDSEGMIPALYIGKSKWFKFACFFKSAALKNS